METNLAVVVSNDNTNTDVESTINAICNAGFKDVFVQWYDKDFEVDQAKQVEMCKQKGLNIIFAHLGYQNINTIWTNEGEHFTERYKKNILDLHNLGIDMVVMHASAKWVAPEPNEIGLNRFKEVIEYAKSLGVKVAMENTKISEHLEYVLNNIDSENLGVCFDLGHYHCNSKDKWNVTKFKNRIFCVHIHDNNGVDDQHLLPFDGNINWNEYMKLLNDLNYHGPITMELCYRNDYNSISPEEFYLRGYKCGLELKKLKEKNY